MEEKKITSRMGNKNYEFFKKIFDDTSDMYALSTFAAECLTAMKKTIDDLKIFDEDEVVALCDAINGWLMDFTKIPAKFAIIAEMEDYYKLNLNTEMPSSFREKLESLTEFQSYTLCRWIKMLWQTEKDVVEKAKFLFEAKQ